MSHRAVFFDRDDTLMVNVPYSGDPAEVEAFAEASLALADLAAAGFLLFVVSNQSGVGRGLDHARAGRLGQRRAGAATRP